MEKGVPFQVRRTNFLRDVPNDKVFMNRTLNIPDDVQEKKDKEAKVKVEEAARDQTWEEFMAAYEKHLEGQVEPILRTHGRKNSADLEGKKGV